MKTRHSTTQLSKLLPTSQHPIYTHLAQGGIYATGITCSDQDWLQLNPVAVRGAIIARPIPLAPGPPAGGMTQVQLAIRNEEKELAAQYNEHSKLLKTV